MLTQLAGGGEQGRQYDLTLSLRWYAKRPARTFSWGGYRNVQHGLKYPTFLLWTLTQNCALSSSGSRWTVGGSEAEKMGWVVMTTGKEGDWLVAHKVSPS